MAQPLRIFISSPGDVTPERRRALLVVQTLAKEYARFFEISAVFWETEPQLASGHFQDNTLPPSKTDVVVLILWSRPGTPLPERTETREYRGIDGRVPVTGTEWEFEDALAAHKASAKGVPDLLAYLKKSEPEATFRTKADLERLGRQLEMLEGFVSRHFVDRGEFRAAFTEFEAPEDFEPRLESDLRQLIERRIAGSPEAPRTWLKEPFRGLAAYGFEHAPIFFGRAAAVKTAIERLSRSAESGRAFLLILGASGSGKSSLAQAGVLPALFGRGVLPGAGLWRRAVMRPTGEPGGPFAALAKALTSETALPELFATGQDASALARHLAAAAEDPAYPILATLGEIERAARDRAEILPHEGARLALIVDQLEELYTAGEIIAEQREAFVRCLDGLAHAGVFVIATMRSDHWHRAAETPLLIEMADEERRIDLLAPRGAEIGEMIRRPALAAGIIFGHNPRTEIGLDADLAEEAAQEPGSLPLLSFLLEALYAKDIHWPDRSTLTYDSMVALRGLKGAIATRADAVIATLPAEVQAALPKVLRALVTVSRSDATPTARAAALVYFAEGTPERRLIEALLAARLLVAEGDRGGAQIRLAHEALITHWELARLQIVRDRDDLRTRADIEVAESKYRAAARDKRGYLLRDPDLANALDLARRWRGELPAKLHEFILQSDIAAKDAERRRWTIAAVVIVALAILSAVSTGAFFLAQRERNDALISQSHFLARDADNAVSQGDAVTGMLLALAALPWNIAHPDRPFVSDAEYALQDAVASQRERNELLGNTASVDFAIFSADGRRIVSASKDETVRIWDATNGAQLAVLRGHQGPVYSVAYSPDGQRIVSASADKSVRIWDATNGSPITVLRGHTGRAQFAAFSPDGRHIVSSSDDRTVRIWDATKGAQLAILRGHEGPVYSVAYSPDGQRIVSASADKSVRVWDATSGAQIAILHGHEALVNCAAFSRDGQRIISASLDKTVRIWDATSGAQVAILRGNEGQVYSAAFSPDGRRAVSSSDDKTVRIWDLASGLQIAVLRGHEDSVWSASFSPNGRLIVSASADQTVRIWDASTGGQIALLRGHEAGVQSVAFSPKGERIVSASADKSVRIWDAHSGAQVAVLRGHQELVWSAAFSPDGRRIASASADDTVRIWDAVSGAQMAVLRNPSGAFSAAFSPDSKRIVSGYYDGAVRIWDSTNGVEIVAFREPGTVSSVSFSPDGRRIVSASTDKTVRVWNAASGAQLVVLRGHEGRVQSAAFSPDGRRIVSAAADQTVRIWDAISGAQLAILRGHKDRAQSAAFSSDGRRVVSASEDQTVRIWDAMSGAQLAVLRGHEGAVWSAAFSPDSRRVVSGSDDKTVRVWDARGAEVAILRGQALIDAARKAVPRQLTAPQRAAEFLPNSPQ